MLAITSVDKALAIAKTGNTLLYFDHTANSLYAAMMTIYHHSQIDQMNHSCTPWHC
jgi:hypothetical protein